MIRGEQQAHAAAADQDARDLGPVIADLEQEEGDDHDDDNSPEIDQLGRENGGVAVGQDDKVVLWTELAMC